MKNVHKGHTLRVFGNSKSEIMECEGDDINTCDFPYKNYVAVQNDTEEHLAITATSTDKGMYDDPNYPGTNQVYFIPPGITSLVWCGSFYETNDCKFFVDGVSLGKVEANSCVRYDGLEDDFVDCVYEDEEQEMEGWRGFN